MATSEYRLSFERPIYELEARLEKLQKNVHQTPEVRSEIRALLRELTETKKRIFGNLKPWETVEVARHQDRPQTSDYLELVFDEFVELHGDKFFGDDKAIRTGWARLDAYKVLVVGHQKGKSYKERTACYFGCAHPEGYRKAMAKMRLAAKFHLPVICLIDTPGAYPGIGAEERGQAQVIAQSMFEMSRLRTPIICVVIGEGGSGGALGIGVGDRIAVLEHAYYSVISPEGCAGILWKSHTFKERAAEALRMTSKDLYALGLIDAIIPEPLGGAHRDHHLMASRLKVYLRNNLRELLSIPLDELVEARYRKFRRMGVFFEQAQLHGTPLVTPLSVPGQTPGDAAAPSPSDDGAAEKAAEPATAEADLGGNG
ncbi:MAG: acetyl-CoA carboxylase carboxyltransferase subunit alpha [Thermoguttaceae bacterium]|jgi:acetyl-CoA carboxylase carboxyl transferase subunit alpha|nr:acetyl-CoA carboxylase carboxyltransferase subunit alpha [Thermoguttaceae bacterium]